MKDRENGTKSKEEPEYQITKIRKPEKKKKTEREKDELIYETLLS